jgi:hypothetical protein
MRHEHGIFLAQQLFDALQQFGIVAGVFFDACRNTIEPGSDDRAIGCQIALCCTCIRYIVHGKGTISVNGNTSG